MCSPLLAAKRKNDSIARSLAIYIVLQCFLQSLKSVRQQVYSKLWKFQQENRAKLVEMGLADNNLGRKAAQKHSQSMLVVAELMYYHIPSLIVVAFVNLCCDCKQFR